MNTFDDFLAGRIGIRFDTKDEYDRLMRECLTHPDMPIHPFSAIARPEAENLGFANPGDTVRIKHDRASGANVSAGDVFTVKMHGYRPGGVIVDGGWAFRPEDYEIVSRAAPTHPKIIITTDGRVTTARLIDGKQTVKEAKATCSPDDAFDFEYGAALAFHRLIPGTVRELRVRLNVDTSALDAALQSVRDAMRDIPNHVKAVKA